MGKASECALKPHFRSGIRLWIAECFGKLFFIICFKRETLADKMEVCYNTPNEGE